MARLGGIFDPDTRLAATAFVVAAIYVPGIPSAAYMPRWWAIAVLIPLLFDLDPRRIPIWILGPLIGGLVWAGISLAWTPIPATGALDLYFMTILALAMIAAAGVGNLEPAVAAFGWGVALSSMLSLAQLLGVAPVDVLRSGPAGLFFNTEIMAETAAPVMAWALFKKRYGIAVALAPAILLSGSRIAPLAILGALWWLWKPSRPSLRWAVLWAGLLAGVAALVIFGPGKADSALSRMVLWGAGALAVTPWGHGIGWWPVTHPGPMTEFAHSDALQLVVEMGIGGAILLAVPILVLWKGNGPDAVRCAFVALCLEGAVSFPLHLPATGFLGALLAGGLVSHSHRFRNTELSRRIASRVHDGWKASFGGMVVQSVAGNDSDLSVRTASPLASGGSASSRGGSVRGRISQAWALMRFES